MTAASIEAADQAALNSPEGQFRNEFVVERGSQKRVLASNRVVARDDKNQPEFLIALFDDVTDRRSLSAGTREHQEIPRTGASTTFRCR